jgi:hypothetical protein
MVVTERDIEKVLDMLYEARDFARKLTVRLLVCQ